MLQYGSGLSTDIGYGTKLQSLLLQNIVMCLPRDYCLATMATPEPVNEDDVADLHSVPLFDSDSRGKYQLPVTLRGNY